MKALRFSFVLLVLGCAATPEPAQPAQALEPSDQVTAQPAPETAPESSAREESDVPADTTRISPEDLEEVKFNSKGIGLTLHPEVGYVYVDVEGRVLYRAANFDNGPDPLVEGRARIEIDGKTGFVDENFQLVIPARFDSAFGFSNGRAKVCTDCDPTIWNKNPAPNAAARPGRVFYIDHDGNELKD